MLLAQYFGEEGILLFVAAINPYSFGMLHILKNECLGCSALVAGLGSSKEYHCLSRLADLTSLSRAVYSSNWSKFPLFQLLRALPGKCFLLHLLLGQVISVIHMASLQKTREEGMDARSGVPLSPPVQWPSNFSLLQNHTQAWPHSQISNSEDLGSDLRIFISNKFAGDADAAILGTILGASLL